MSNDNQQLSLEEHDELSKLYEELNNIKIVSEKEFHRDFRREVSYENYVKYLEAQREKISKRILELEEKEEKGLLR